MSDLVEFLLARIAEDEAAARAAMSGRSGRWASWNRSWDAERNRDLVDEEAGERMACLPMDLDEHIARHDPARVLAECEAKRRIVELHGPHEAADTLPCRELASIAAVYADHPDYDEAWRP